MSKEEKYQGSLKHQENARRAFAIAREKMSLKKQKRIEEYDKNPKVCKACGKIFSYEQRGKMFCNSSCAASFNNKQHKLKESTKKKISEALHSKGHSDLEKLCKNCNKNFVVHWNKRHQKFCSVRCAHIYNIDIKRNKISQKAQERIKNGTFSGWKSRKDKSPSYPEQYFIGLFNNENIIGWERDYKVGRWFVDFAFIDLKIALEIDGKQHEDRKEQDKTKDDFLTNKGWKVYRIKWHNPINNKNKKLLYEQISNFRNLLL